ncbi:hypothetical protein V8F06_013463 [Rhypophila decipiens]
MRVFQTASILAAFGCLVTLAGARVPKSHDDAPSKETPICCTPGCLACATEVCDKSPCTASIFFAACCATAGVNAKFYDPDHNELNVTRAEFLLWLRLVLREPTTKLKGQSR